MNAYDDFPPCPRCGGYDCIVDDEGVCQARITEDEIRWDCDAKAPHLTEAFVSLWKQGRVNVKRDGGAYSGM